MDDKKEKLKAALLEFAGTLGLGTKDSRTKYKKAIIENFTEVKFSDNKQPIKEQTDVPAVSKELFTDYLDEIESIFGGETEKKSPGVISEEVERYVNERVSEVSSRLQQSMLGGTGGGTVSQQYKEGGTMDGNLHVMGRKKGLEYISPDAVSILTNPALQVNQHSTGTESIAQFYDDSTLKVDIDSVGNTTIYENLSVIKNVNIEGNLNVVGTSVISGGNITLGDSATSDNIVFYADVNSHIEPNADGDFDLGSVLQKWRTLHVNNVSAHGHVQLGDGVSDSITYHGRVRSDILPDPNLTHKLGAVNNAWAEVNSEKILASSILSTTLTAGSSILTDATVTNLTGINTYTGTDATVTNLTGTNVVVVSGGIPLSATDTGTTGTFKFDASHLYICISANGWKRVALSGF